jgi:hypothetical protein
MKVFLFITFLIIISFNSFSQIANKVVGVWLTEEKTEKLKFTKKEINIVAKLFG